MNKVPIRDSGSAELQKRRSRISLCIRLIVFLGITLTYFILHISSKSSNGHNASYGRKLLSIIPISSSNQENQYLPKNISESNSTNFFKNQQEKLTNISNSTVEPFGLISTTTERNNNGTNENQTEIESNCSRPAINEFPSDSFTRVERQQGWILIHILLACYCFWILAAVCDDYFVPSVELLCNSLKMQKDVVGATFMAAATSSPELFINCVGTFVTKGDIGIGTIVGSAVFNILAVPACCGLFAGQIIALDWWPVSRDCLMYCVAVLGLIGTLYDGKVMWYEALLLVLAYFGYMFAMYCNDMMARKARKIISKCRRKIRTRPYREVTEITPLLTSGMLSKQTSEMEPMIKNIIYESNKQPAEIIRDSLETISSNSSDLSDFADDPWTRNESNSLFIYILRWPITFLLWITIPDCRKHRKLRFITFLFSIFWIGMISYLVAFFITYVGDTFNIPDSVMGLTILAAGMSIPEAVSSVIVTNQGHGAMGICNSIGSNTFDILLCLGLPWFIKAYFMPTIPNEQYILLKSTGLQYSAISLLTTLFGLYVAFLSNRFRLDWKIGLACSIMYISFLILASMIELNFFFNVNLPVCEH